MAPDKLVRSIGVVRGVARRHRVPVVFAAGAAVGVVVALIAVNVVYPALTRSGWEPGGLVIVSGRDESAGGQRQKLVDQWNAMYPDHRATITELPSSADAQHAEMTARAQSDAVDVFNLDVTWTAEFADAGITRPLDESALDTSGFLTGPLSTCRYRDKLWALPFNTDAGLLFYRKDLVSKPQPSWTWSQMRTEAERIFAEPASAHPKLAATYTGQLADYEGLTVNALEAIWATDGEVVNRTGDVVVDKRADEIRDGLRRLAQGLGPGNPQLILPETVQYNEALSAQAFRDGKVIFMRNWPIEYRNLAGQTKVSFEVAKLPGPSVLGGQDLAVAQRSGHPRAAQALIEFLTNARSQQILFERGGFAATQKIVYQDEQVTKTYPYAQVLLSAIADARPRPITSRYADFSNEFRRSVTTALAKNGDLPPDTQKRLTGALKGYHAPN
jgi:multiple sugar transport system substrate-binding protein